jgi:hypothetical protein
MVRRWLGHSTMTRESCRAAACADLNEPPRSSPAPLALSAVRGEGMRATSAMTLPGRSAPMPTHSIGNPSALQMPTRSLQRSQKVSFVRDAGGGERERAAAD